MTTQRRTIVVILGPTAIGKSSLAISLAKQHRGIIISADSRQVYRGLDIGSGKVTRTERKIVPHFLLDVASPKSQYSIARYVKDVCRILKRIPIDTPIFLVGGSPFYIDALLKPGSFSPIPPNPALRRRLARHTNAQLLRRLHRLNPSRAQTIDPANRRRIIRAIEISIKPPRNSHKPLPILTNIQVLKIGLRLPNRKLFTRIDARVESRMKRGMLAEVRRLHAQDVPWSRLDSFGLEYRFLTKILRGQVTRRDGITALKGAIHAFARRQMTWWKRDTEIQWFENHQAASNAVKKWIRLRNA